MAQKNGTLSVLVNSVSRFKFIADRKELVDQAKLLQKRNGIKHLNSVDALYNGAL